MATIQIKEGEFTSTIYGHIRDQRYVDAVRLLNHQLETHPTSRAALSLLGYCHFQLQSFVDAADCYEQLSILHPDVENYKLYYAQSLYKACLYQEAMKIACQIESSDYQVKVTKLQAAIKYGEEDLPGAKALVDQCPPQDSDTELNQACILFKENHFEEACKKFVAAMQVTGYNAETAYSIALCFYMMKQYSASLKYINEIIERGAQEHPDLDIGMTTMGLETRSVGNTLVLQETGLVQAFNLKANIEYQLKNIKAAREALTDMPPRSEEELDVVTLHNQALINMDIEPTRGFGKLQFLMQQPTFPPETFGNLLILYIKYEYFDLAADVLAENAHLTFKYLMPELYDFLEAVIMRQTSPEDAYRKLDEMASRKTETLRKLTKQVQQSKQNGDEEALKKAVNEYDDALETYIPILMQQARIHWDMENYVQVEKIFQTSVEFCNDHDIWKLNVAHVLFMQEKYKDATGFYEAILKKNYEQLQDISAIVLANLCVSYIMTNQNEEAEAVMRKLEQEEEKLAHTDPDKKVYHLCIVNMVIGTLYCAKGNYEFGISRVIKSLEPYQKKLVTDTWFYAKRCFLSLIENMAKHMVMIRDSVVQECITFLEHCEIHGLEVKAMTEQPLEEEPLNPGKNTVSYEARMLKSILMQL
ncbi:tetratricopeptide repeat protein 30A isoform X1 [Octopus bimaculoides]|uniref:Tetratricopeptide repeat protein 30 n=1 Tax=Octopus bimaculoides TaxID=37653 RepID=A0A0L8H549_OCTBM|nr:tetratricopeptide repeat protein 30A isoform X1 [Octopus bimaculoides]|eukprot:XP_014775288.1 PREDICTED: tetratricopeptide repeat protein 30A-like isoform X1 [Octopus bimaculoides]